MHDVSPLPSCASFASPAGSVLLVDGRRLDYNAAQAKVGGDFSGRFHAGKSGFKIVW